MLAAISHILDLAPYSWRLHLADLIMPHRKGLSPVLREMPKDLRVVFDIGANIGQVSLSMLHYFPRADVYSFEPSRTTYQMLIDNIARQGHVKRHHPFRLGFYDAATTGTLNITSFHGANSMLNMTDEYKRLHPHLKEIQTEEIPLVTLDDFVAQNNIDHIDLAKIDVEGVERQILLGGKKTFSTKVDRVILEISFLRHPAKTGEYIELFQTMHQLGFIPCKLFDVAQTEKGPMDLTQFDCVFRKF